MILHRESDNGLSKVIRNAYLNYEIMEFGEKAVDINDPQRRIKLISVAGKKVYFYHVGLFMVCNVELFHLFVCAFLFNPLSSI